MARFFCETHEVTHTEGECPVCIVEYERREIELAMNQEAVLTAERHLKSYMQESDRLRAQQPV